MNDIFWIHFYYNCLHTFLCSVYVCVKLMVSGVHGSPGVNVQHLVEVENGHVSDSVTIHHPATTAVPAQETPPSYQDVIYSHVQVHLQLCMVVNQDLHQEILSNNLFIISLFTFFTFSVSITFSKMMTLTYKIKSNTIYTLILLSVEYNERTWRHILYNFP